MLRTLYKKLLGGDNPSLYRFEDYEFDGRSDVLSRNGRRVALPPKAARFLGLLLEASGELVSTRDLINGLWGEAVVDYQQNLHYCISTLRKALDDQAGQPSYIETVPRKGYRFIATVQRSHPKTPTYIMAATTGLFLLVAAVILFNSLSRPDWEGDRRWAQVQYLLEQRDAQVFDEALDLTSQLVIDYPDAAPIWAMHARALRFNQGDIQEIRTAIDQSLSLDKGIADAWEEKGYWLLFGDLKITEARGVLQKAVALNPDLFYARYLLGMSFFLEGNLDSAIIALEEALELKPVSTQLMGDIGWFYLLAGRLGEARGQCEESLLLLPAQAYPHRCLMDINLLEGNHEAARLHAVESAKAYGASEDEAAEIHRDWPSQGEQAFYQWFLAHLQATQPSNYLDLAVAYQRLGDDNKARATLLEAKNQKSVLGLFAAQLEELKPLSPAQDI